MEINFDPVAFWLGPIPLRWYGLMYVFGFLFFLMLGRKKIRRSFKKDSFTLTDLDDLILFGVLGVLVGGRFGYVLFYNPSYFAENLSDIFAVWKGGMSFHGGLIGVIFVSIWFANKNKDNPFKYLDIVSLMAPIGIFFGRIANFINSELYGIETNLPWAVQFVKIDELYRHPSQLYEAFFEGIILFLILIYFRNKGLMKTPGLISGLFLIFYSVFRFIIEFIRVPDEQLGYLFLNLSMGQIISFIFLLLGIYLFIKKYEKQKET